MKQYYYSDGLQKHGPFSLEEMKSQGITRSTLVWFHPMEKWLPAEEFPELQEVFGFAPPPIQASPPRHDDFAKKSTPSGKPPHSWLVESILVTLFCCMPFGIVGIVYAAKVESRYNSGDIEGAERSSQEAKKWTIIGFASTIIIVVIYAIFLGFFVVLDQN